MFTMCGIFGALGFNNSRVPNAEKSLEITKSLVHRGPDAINVFVQKDFALGHTRLAIIDLDKGNQPMFSEDKRWVLSYNGEIYNFVSLKKDLKELGLNFNTQSDTEVLLKGLIKFGFRFLNKVEGMFAFALYDNKKKELLLGRDHVGMKPLYYSATSQHFVFGSEPKVLFKSNLVPKKINERAIFEYFCRHSPPYLETIYQNIFEVEPGTCLKINTKKVKRKYTYYKIENGWQKVDSKDVILDKSEILLKFRKKFTDSVNKHLVSDVPIGIALSGGLDSNIIFDFLKENNDMSKFKTFTYATQGRGNEAKIVKKILNKSKAVNHKIVKLSLNLQINNIKKLSEYFDGPISYPSSMSLEKLSETASNENYKVLISGQGADELFFGYTRYNYWRKKLNSIKDKRTWSDNLFFGMGIGNIDLVENITGKKRNIVEESETWNWVQNNWHLPVNKRMNIFDQKFRLLHLLKREDITGMKNSVEYRLPYLDVNFINWANALGEINRSNKGLPKNILNRTIKNLISEKKLGSISTIDRWFNSNNFFTKILSIIKEKDSLSKNYLNFDEINKLFVSKSMRFRSAYILKNLYFLEMWFKNEKKYI